MNIKLQTRLKLIEILIKEQWDDIQRVLSSLVIGKTTQSISPIAWTNINMNGRYQFKGYKEDININESISILKEYFYNEMAPQPPIYH